MPGLQDPYQRDDGLPWIAWDATPTVHHGVAGCRERVELVAWYSWERQRMVITVTRYDETMRQYQPCWAQVAAVDVGPFLARSEITSFAERWVDAVLDVVDPE